MNFGEHPATVTPLSLPPTPLFSLYREHHCADYDRHLTGQSQWGLYRLRVFPHHSQRSVCAASEYELTVHSLLHWDPRSFQVRLRHSHVSTKCELLLRAQPANTYEVPAPPWYSRVTLFSWPQLG